MKILSRIVQAQDEQDAHMAAGRWFPSANTDSATHPIGSRAAGACRTREHGRTRHGD
jgi:hypothetical protein